ncbi:DUF6153 family protein [Streptomyces sp. S.PB5]|uniref:DUF6153 family protein n=1 Tax=Streptomyces sp. S.PB5 TaxID=3020844 RepID=UPI0025AF760E|nr:DUF6153 family protein [Streptomyces sp. S.PB5]MDN3021404.1 DUF6153 family protein [Streptomyces sp. S.PB5]
MATVRVGAARWACGVVVALFAALAVLVHHETAMITPPAQHTAPHTARSAHSVHSGHATPGTATTPAAAAQGSTARPAHPHGIADGTCADPGMQHCTTASVDTVKLVPPPQNLLAQAANPHRAGPVRSPAGTVGRAPPDLSVLSRLRI